MCSVTRVHGGDGAVRVDHQLAAQGGGEERAEHLDTDIVVGDTECRGTPTTSFMLQQSACSTPPPGPLYQPLQRGWAHPRPRKRPAASPAYAGFSNREVVKSSGGVAKG